MPQIEVPGHGIVEFPDDMTDEQIASAIQQNMPDVQAQQPAVQPEAPSGFVRGMMDPINAGAQLLAKITPSRIEESVNRFNNWLADRGVPLQRLPEGGVSQQITEAEKQYQAERAAAGETGVDWSRLAGNILSPANLAVAAKIPQAATLGGRVLTGAGTGAYFGAAQPVTQGDFWTEKGKQVGMGAAVGGALPLATGAVARVIRPQTSPEVQQLMKAGVTPTPGQIMGGRTKIAEEKLMSLPLLGDAIASAKTKNLDQFQRAAYQRALDPIGEKAGPEVGRRGIESVHNALTNAYEKILPKVQFKADQQFAQELNTVKQMVNTLPKEHARFFEQTLKRELFGRMTPQGNMSGASLKAVESRLGEIAKNYSGRGGFEGDIGNAIKEVQSIVRANLERANPQMAGELAKVNAGWANYAILRDAASKQGAKEGIFTPAQLASSVLANAKKGTGALGKARVSEGKALMQDLTEAGQKVLSQEYPDSGTFGRMALGLGTIGAGSQLSPAALAGTGLASLAYLPGGRQTIASLMTQRPAMALPISESVRRLGPILTPGAVTALQNGNQ